MAIMPPHTTAAMLRFLTPIALRTHAQRAPSSMLSPGITAGGAGGAGDTVTTETGDAGVGPAGTPIWFIVEPLAT